MNPAGHTLLPGRICSRSLGAIRIGIEIEIEIVIEIDS